MVTPQKVTLQLSPATSLIGTPSIPKVKAPNLTALSAEPENDDDGKMAQLENRNKDLHEANKASRASGHTTRSTEFANVCLSCANTKAIVGITFDNLHEHGRMSWTSESTPFSYPVFVRYRTMPDGSQKALFFTDARGLNAVIQANVYHRLYTSVVDCVIFCQGNIVPEKEVMTDQGPSFNSV